MPISATITRVDMFNACPSRVVDMFDILIDPGGAVAVQGGSFVYLELVFRAVYHGLKQHFPVVKPINCVTQLYPGM